MFSLQKWTRNHKNSQKEKGSSNLSSTSSSSSSMFDFKRSKKYDKTKSRCSEIDAFVDYLGAYGALRVKFYSEDSRKTVRYTLAHRQVMDDLKASFKSMVRACEPPGLLESIKLLERTVKDRRDLLEVVNAGSSNEAMSVLHKQVKAGNVLKIVLLVERLPCLDIVARDKQNRTAADIALASATNAPGDINRLVAKYLKAARRAGSITGLKLTPRGRVSRGKGAMDASQSSALIHCIKAYFNKIDGLYRLRKIVKDADPAAMRKHLRMLEASLCDLCDLSHIIDLKKVGKRDAKTALQKAMERTDKARDDVVRVLIKAGASSRFLKKDKHVREANAIARAVLLEATAPLSPGANSSNKSSGPAHLLMPVKPVFGSVLSTLVRRESVPTPGAAGLLPTKTKKKKKKTTSLSIVVPSVVRQCGDFLQEYGLKMEGIFRIPGDMGSVKRLKQLFNTSPTGSVNLKAELMFESVNVKQSDGDGASRGPIGASSSMTTPTGRSAGGKKRGSVLALGSSSQHYRRSSSVPSLRTALASEESLKRHSMTVATLLKCFFRELQQPLISALTMESLQEIVARAPRPAKQSEDSPSAGNEDGDAKTKEEEEDAFAEKTRATLEAIRSAVCESMDRPNLVCLTYLLRLLSDVTAESEVNKMTPRNLAVCWAPSLSFNVSTPTDLMASIQGMAKDRKVVEYMITHGRAIFDLLHVPADDAAESDDGGDDDDDDDDESTGCAMTATPPSTTTPDSPARLVPRVVTASKEEEEEDEAELTLLRAGLWTDEGERNASIRVVDNALRIASRGHPERALDILDALKKTYQDERSLGEFFSSSVDVPGGEILDDEGDADGGEVKRVESDGFEARSPAMSL